MRARIGGACAIGWLAVVSSAALGAERVAVLVPQLHPQGVPELRDRFQDAVVRGAQSPDLSVLSAAEVRMRLGHAEEMLSCTGVGPCVARAAAELHVERLVATDITIVGKEYAIKLRAVDAGGQELGHVDDACDICTIKEAEEAVARAAGKLGPALRASVLPPSTSTTTPPTPTPPPPTEKPLPPTDNRLESPDSLKEEAPPPKPAPVAGSEYHHTWRYVAIGSATLGVLALASGIGLVAIDGNPTCDAPNPQTSCPEVYDTLPSGAALIAVGSAGLVASGLLFWLDHRASHRAAGGVSIVPSVVPTAGGAFVSAGGRF